VSGPSFWSDFLASFRDPESYLKLLLLGVSSPFWWPIARSFWKEAQKALAPEGGLFGIRPRHEVARRPPGLDPFASLPWAGGPSGTVSRAESATDRAPLAPVRRRGF